MGRGVNPLGDEVLDALGDWWASGPCVERRLHNDRMSNPEATVAAIDCGTNSIKLLIGTVRDDGQLDVALRDSRVVRLGQGVDRTGVLADEALERTFAAIDELAEMHPRPRRPARAGPLLRDVGDPRREQRRRLRRGRTPSPGRRAGGAVRRRGGRAGLRRRDRRAGPDAARAGARRRHRRRVDRAGAGARASDRQAVSMDIGSVRLHERHLHADPPTADRGRGVRGRHRPAPRRLRDPARPRPHRHRHLRHDQDDRVRRAGPGLLRPRGLRPGRAAQRRHRRPSSTTCSR